MELTFSLPSFSNKTNNTRSEVQYTLPFPPPHFDTVFGVILFSKNEKILDLFKRGKLRIGKRTNHCIKNRLIHTVMHNIYHADRLILRFSICAIIPSTHF